MYLQKYAHIPLPDIPDDVLARQTRAGDQGAFETLMRRYHALVFSFIYRLMGDYELACDVSQDVFLQLYTSTPPLCTDKPLKAWLLQVARNRCVDELRKKQALHFSQLEQTNEEEGLTPLDLLADSCPLPEEIAEQHDLQRMLQQAIGALPLKFRSIVRLRYAQLSYTEIGQMLKMPKGRAKTYFWRARPLLRAALASQAQTTRCTSSLAQILVPNR